MKLERTLGPAVDSLQRGPRVACAETRGMTDRRLFVAIENYRNRCLGTLIRCASAFGAAAVLVVGSKVYSTHGAHGAQKYVQVIHFHYWEDCVAFLASQDCLLVGLSPSSAIADGDSSKPPAALQSVTVQRSVCVALGPKSNITTEMTALCDQVVYVPMPSAQFEDYVHYDAKVALCLQHFASLAGFHTTRFHGGKFETSQLPCRIDVPLAHTPSSAAEEEVDAGVDEDAMLALFGEV